MSNQYPDPDGYWQNNPGWHAAPPDGPGGNYYDAHGYPGAGGYSGSAGYGGGGYGGQWGPTPPPYPEPPPDKTSTIWALVLGITGFLCCATNLIAVVFAAVALSKDREPGEMARFTRYAWISNAVHLALLVVFALFMVVVIILDS